MREKKGCEGGERGLCIGRREMTRWLGEGRG